MKSLKLKRGDQGINKENVWKFLHKDNTMLEISMKRKKLILYMNNKRTNATLIIINKLISSIHCLTTNTKPHN